MVEITKEELLGGKYADAPKWREKKTSRAKFKEFVTKNKIITIGLGAFTLCVAANLILLYNFIRIISVL